MRPFRPGIKKISRLYFWIDWIIFNLFSCGVFWLTAMEYMNHSEHIMNLILLLEIAVYLSYFFLLTLKRFHDVGKSAGLLIICFLLIPIGVGLFLILSICSRKSELTNKWGNPVDEFSMFENMTGAFS